MGGATVLGLICGYRMTYYAFVAHPHHLSDVPTFLFLFGPALSLFFVVVFAATAQMLLEVCAVEGS
eukprot:COSAG06_NODE_36518_length_446_cov_0.899135_1_plen_65_part_10